MWFVKEESETGQKKVSIFPSRHLYKYFSFSPDRRFSEASYSIQIHVKTVLKRQTAVFGNTDQHGLAALKV